MADVILPLTEVKRRIRDVHVPAVRDVRHADGIVHHDGRDAGLDRRRHTRRHRCCVVILRQRHIPSMGHGKDGHKEAQ